MLSIFGKSFLVPASLFLFAASALANHHHELNGAWQLIPSRSVLNGGPAIQSGTVTINDREGNVYVDRNFNLTEGNRTVTTNFFTDAREKASIKQPGLISKAKWEGDLLKVVTTQDGVTTVERYSLSSDGSMILQVDRTGRPPETLVFERQ
jgi:hypothetical protein